MSKLVLTIGTTLGLAAFAFAISADAQKTPAQLNSEFQTCAAQGKGPNCITVTNMQDIIGTLTSGTVASVAQYGATTSSSDNSAAFQSAVNAARTVFVPSGTWNVCAQVTLPVGEHILSYDSNPNPGSNGPNEAWSNTIITCQTTGSFSNGQAFLNLQDHDVIEGLSIYGLNQTASGLQLNCINALNAVSVTIRNNSFIDCYNGISRFSNGSVSGASEYYSQLATIEGNLFYRNSLYGYYAAYDNSGFVSDELIGPNNDFVVNGSGGVYLNPGPYFTGHIFANRFEDAAIGIILINTSEITITGNNFDKIQALYASGVTFITVTGNREECCLSGGGINNEFVGTNSYVIFSGNDEESYSGSAAYKVDAGGSITMGLFAENPPVEPFYDANTAAVISPLLAASAGAAISPVSLFPGNQLPGSPNFANGWPLTGATKTTGITDPNGGTTAIELTEDTSTGSHEVSASVSLIGGQFGCGAYVHIGTSGTRNVGFYFSDSSFDDYFDGVINPSTGTVISAAFGGTATLSSTPTVLSAGNGWYKVVFQANTPSGISVEAAGPFNGTNGSYTGDGASNIQIWGLNCNSPSVTVTATGATTQTFTNSPCATGTTEQWIQTTLPGQSGFWYVPACH